MKLKIKVVDQLQRLSIELLEHILGHLRELEAPKQSIDMINLEFPLLLGERALCLAIESSLKEDTHTRFAPGLVTIPVMFDLCLSKLQKGPISIHVQSHVEFFR